MGISPRGEKACDYIVHGEGYSSFVSRHSVRWPCCSPSSYYPWLRCGVRNDASRDNVLGVETDIKRSFGHQRPVLIRTQDSTPSQSVSGMDELSRCARANAKMSRIHVLRYMVTGFGKPRSANLCRHPCGRRHGRSACAT
jgi:hypothetical protein